MSESRCRPVHEASASFRATLWPVVCISIALAACSGDTNAQGTHPHQVQVAQAASAPSTVPTVPAIESTVRALPDRPDDPR